MLGRLKMSTEEALQEYDRFAHKIFSTSNRKIALSDRFKASTLQEAIEDLVARRGKGQLMSEPKEIASDCKTFVCAMPTRDLADPRRFRSYEVEGDRFKSCKIWEAARATSAAPTFFKAITIQDEAGIAEDFVDAAMGYNNPVEWLISEAGSAFNRSRKLGCVVSIGTGTKPKSMERSLSGAKNIARVLKLMKDITTDCERSHRAMEKLLQDFPGTYFRFNVPSAAEEVGLDEWKKLGSLKEMTSEYLEKAEQAEKVAEIGDMLATKAGKGLNVGHICYPSKAQVVASLRRAQPRGLSSPFFTGRGRVLQQMRQYFGSRNDHQTRAREFLVYGMGGSGKTQVALKFTEEMEEEDRFDLVFWIDATNEVTIKQSYKSVASTVFPDDPGDGKSMPRVLDWLSETVEDWLMVFDNCGAEPLTSSLPSRRKGNILYTSRYDLRARFTSDAVANINEMELDDAILLLLKTSSGWDSPEILGGHEAAKSVAVALGRLPLALDQAGAYMREKQCSFEDYFRLYWKQKDTILQNPLVKGAVAENLAVYATFDISFEALEERFKEQRHSQDGLAARGALQILSMICYYHNHNVLRETVGRAARTRHKTDRGIHYPLGNGDFSLEHLVEMEEGVWNPTNFDLGRDLLASYSLIKMDTHGEYISMHILLHSWARSKMEQLSKSTTGGSARALLFDSIPFSRAQKDFIYRRKLAPHVDACEEYVKLKNPDDLLESEYDGRLAVLKKEAGMFDAAEAHLESAIAKRREVYGADTVPIISAIEGLADVYEAQGRYADAADKLYEAIERRGGLPKDDQRNLTKLIRDKEDLAGVLILLDQREAATQLLEEVVTAREKMYGPNSMDSWGLIASRESLQRTRSRQSDRYLDKEDLEASIEILGHAERLCGSDSTAAMSARRSVALALAQAGRYREAEKLYMEIYEHFKELRGESDPYSYAIVHCLAGVLQDQGRHLEAETLFRSYFVFKYQTLGKRHFDTLGALIGLAMSFTHQGRFMESELLMQKVHDYLEAQFGSTHVLVEEAKSFLNQAARAHGMCQELLRRKCTEAALAASRAALGDLMPPDIDMIMAIMPQTFSGELPEWDFLTPRDIQRIQESIPDPVLFCSQLQEPLTEELEMEILEKWLKSKAEQLKLNDPETT
ncbi:uncharacterized protein E0L32_003663 [Thyridium curvatum]|uniref:Uncharacterized protein n=1 Tax=Thyridium curvatum TaxID=1093900 RepID=A0A507B394_9PEZI|nr:uncharacterized protein E0L32_003663 [Thyridium curvatum]TPX16722.1 hypothetical protein E0L32_003663 [Thyridium curvatum]